MTAMVGGVRLSMLGGFELTYGRARVATPLGAQRLLAYLALQEGGVHRAIAAERLWPDCSPGRAGANVRSALWRGRRVGTETVIECPGHRLSLARSVAVDLRELLAELASPLGGPDLPSVGTLVDLLGRELLPDWPEDWLMLERERWDQTRLHTLERLAQFLLSQERYLEALQTALGAVAIEPIREAAHRLVIEVHIAEGNVASALRYYHRYRSLLQHELGVAPSPRMAQLVRPLMGT